VLTCQDLQVLRIKHRRELPMTFLAMRVHLLFHLHRDVPFGYVMGTSHIEGLSL